MHPIQTTVHFTWLITFRNKLKTQGVKHTKSEFIYLYIPVYSLSVWDTQDTTVLGIFRTTTIEYKPLSRIICDSGIKIKAKIDQNQL